MSGNEITEIDGFLFSNLSKLEVLKFKGNKITRIGSITFKALTKLDSLLEENSNLFDALNNLKCLSININERTEIWTFLKNFLLKTL